MIKQAVFKKILNNGLTILVRPIHIIPKVSVQLWYNVGSKDENSNEKGIAHFIEHMIFKGTKKLSESDINLITNKLSGYCNAFTSYDYTSYIFDFPSQNWKESLPILADCMRNCTFKEELLTSELKAVIQELKMYKDDYPCALLENMMNTIFPGHPYQHPIIGYKQDLWNLTRENLVRFYEKHYIPNNATLVVVGDVDPEEVFAAAEENFATIEPNWHYKKEEFLLNKDIANSVTTIYRDVQQPTVIAGFIMPGAKEKIDFLMDALCLILAEGRDSRLHKKLVNEKNLVTDISAYSYDLFDHELLFIQFDPKNERDTALILSIIEEEIEKIKQDGFTDKEITRTIKRVEASFLNLLENNQKQAYALGKFYLATGDENFIYNYIEHDHELLIKKLQDLVTNYVNASLVHIGKILPIQKKDLPLWQKLQAESDRLDERILSKKEREYAVEAGVVVEGIHPNPYPQFDFPKYKEQFLKNGLDVLYYKNSTIGKVDLILELKAKNYYDPQGLEGISSFVSEMLLEGTKKLSGEELAHEIESFGMSLKTSPGYITMSMLNEDFEKGLTILADILQDSIFDDKAIERVRDRLIADIKDYWDSPVDFADQLIREEVYKGHPFSKNIYGSLETIAKITKHDLIDFYKRYISPQGARIAIVGDFNEKAFIPLLEKTIGAWHGPTVEDIAFPALTSPLHDKNYTINRDQVVFAFIGRSINRYHPDFDKILLFDQIFGGGVLGSMSSRLFQIREQSGLFYTISGSLLANTGEQPGMFIVKTIVSLDRLKEAENLIEKEIKHAAQEITDQELDQAKNALINSRVDSFASNKQIASSFLFLKKYNLPQDFFDKRAEQLLKVNKVEIQEAVEKIINSPMFKLQIGRIEA